MVRKRPVVVKTGLAEWLGTYGDVVTLLLCFFVLLYSMSSVDAAKFQSIAISMSDALSPSESGAADGILEALGNGIVQMPISVATSEQDRQKREAATKELSKMASDFKTYFAKSELADKVVVTQDDQSITLNFKDGMLFDSGSAVLRADAFGALDGVANELIRYADNDLKIEGHTDNRPIQTTQYPNNMYLSSARAISVFIYFVDEKSMDPMRISTEGFGEYRPIAPNDTPENRSKNRRVEIKIMSKFYSNPSVQ